MAETSRNSTILLIEFPTTGRQDEQTESIAYNVSQEEDHNRQRMSTNYYSRATIHFLVVVMSLHDDLLNAPLLIGSTAISSLKALIAFLHVLLEVDIKGYIYNMSACSTA